MAERLDPPVAPARDPADALNMGKPAELLALEAEIQVQRALRPEKVIQDRKARTRAMLTAPSLDPAERLKAIRARPRAPEPLPEHLHQPRAIGRR